jgi:hypothetical protein
MATNKTDEIVWARFTDGRLIARECDFPNGVPRTGKNLTATNSSAGRACDAAPAPSGRMTAAISAFRARVAARAFDALQAERRQADYSHLQAQYDAARGVPRGFGGVAYDSVGERDFVRRRYRALHGLDSARDNKVDLYVSLQAQYDAARRQGE